MRGALDWQRFAIVALGVAIDWTGVEGFLSCTQAVVMATFRANHAIRTPWVSGGGRSAPPGIQGEVMAGLTRNFLKFVLTTAWVHAGRPSTPEIVNTAAIVVIVVMCVPVGLYACLCVCRYAYVSVCL